jgi:hypothetical protein
MKKTRGHQYQYNVNLHFTINLNIYFYLNINFISIQFFIIYVPSQQPQGQLQAQHSVDKIIIT